MSDKSLGEALAAADAANREDLRGLYPMAARVLAGEYRAMKDLIDGMKIDMERLNTKNMALKE
jgi:translation elongation factor EF-4